jgi:hypothetical protein
LAEKPGNGAKEVGPQTFREAAGLIGKDHGKASAVVLKKIPTGMASGRDTEFFNCDCSY